MQGQDWQWAAVPQSRSARKSALWTTRYGRQALVLVVDQCPGALECVGRRFTRGRRQAETGAQAAFRASSGPEHPECPGHQERPERPNGSRWPRGEPTFGAISPEALGRLEPVDPAGATSFGHTQRRVTVGTDDDLLSVAGGDKPQLLAAVLADVPLEERPRIGADRYAHALPLCQWFKGT